MRKFWGGELLACCELWSTATGDITVSGQEYAFSDNVLGTSRGFDSWDFLGGVFDQDSLAIICRTKGIVGTVVADVWLSGSGQAGSNNESAIWWRMDNQPALPNGVRMLGGVGGSRAPLQMLASTAGQYGAVHYQYTYCITQGIDTTFYINPKFLSYRNPVKLSEGGVGSKISAKAYARNAALYMWRRLQ